MLRNIMEALARKESLSMSKLANEVGSSVRELESALEQMKHMGYVHRQSVEQACSSSCKIDQRSGHCEGCRFLSSEALAVWVLTDKGKMAVKRKPNI